MTRPTATHPLAALLLAFAAAQAPAQEFETEPNNDFFSSNFLSPGTTLVYGELYDEFGGGFNPNTLLGARNLFGDVVQSDDNGSPLGDGFASALYDVPTNSGSADFVITGVTDFGFFGDHGETGGYEAFVTVYDLFGEQVDFFSFTDELTPGLSNEYSFSDFSYLNGTYDVEIDNTFGPLSGSAGEPGAVGGGGDVDFFTFTGLTPGETFVAETIDDQSFDIDTILGWYDEQTGQELDFNDDAASGTLLSKIVGTVPANGNVTLGVTAYDDFFFAGDHSEQWPYALQLTIPPPGDYNLDGVVDAIDYTFWRDVPSAYGGPAGYDTWAMNYGATSATSTAVPEPAAALLAAFGLAACLARR